MGDKRCDDCGELVPGDTHMTCRDRLVEQLTEDECSCPGDGRDPDCPIHRDPPLRWRGSVSDLVTDLRDQLTPAQWNELAFAVSKELAAQALRLSAECAAMREVVVCARWWSVGDVAPGPLRPEERHLVDAVERYEKRDAAVSQQVGGDE